MARLIGRRLGPQAAVVSASPGRGPGPAPVEPPRTGDYPSHPRPPKPPDPPEQGLEGHGPDPPMIPTLATDVSAYLPIGMLCLMAIGFVVVNLIGTHILGPVLRGETKEITYESGMNPFGSARKRFNVRFYILAMTFLVFDVEIIFLYPWAVTYTKLDPMSSEAMLYLGRILFFILTSIIAYVYAWRKGVFRFE